MPDPCVGPNRITGVEDILCMKPPKFLPDYKNPCWHDGNTFRCLPYFHLIGICKSATSDVFKRLYMHPDIIPNRGVGNKETWYWSWRRLDILKINGTFNQGMTLKDFTDKFRSSELQAKDAKGKHNKITGHGDPMDFWDRFEDRNTPQNIPGADELLWTTPYAVRHVNPNVKLLLMLRDPVERLFSHYIHLHYGTSAQCFHEHVVISIERWNNCTNSHTIRHCIYDQPLFKNLPAPILTSFYIVHLLEWLKVFPREQILIFRNEDYTVDMMGTLTDIFRFLDVGVPSDSVVANMTDMTPFFVSEKRKSAGKILPETKRLLMELYRPYNEQLAAFLGDERYTWRDASFPSVKTVK
ncbi:carbohydrate sulfotransferase 15-like isoform X2 [Dreissena polymorpha]|nr:carbohydrate sulfotransferase 15-like isoform X2 [Dreissena polymorpha]XP_052276804.1 carbohydrate sulfotransferase 15-like isoform X2 [Dreissena polymorpha]